MLKQSETLRMVLTFAMVVNGLPLRRFSTIRKAIEVWLKIIVKAKLIQPSTKLSPLLQETDKLISILFKSIDTAKKKNERYQQKHLDIRYSVLDIGNSDFKYIDPLKNKRNLKNNYWT